MQNCKERSSLLFVLSLSCLLVITTFASCKPLHYHPSLWGGGGCVKSITLIIHRIIERVDAAFRNTALLGGEKYAVPQHWHFQNIVSNISLINCICVNFFLNFIYTRTVNYISMNCLLNVIHNRKLAS